MRRKMLFIGTLLTSLLATTPVMAFNWGNIVNNTQKQSTDKEILFRDIPWGTSYTDAVQLQPDFDWYTIAFDESRITTLNEILTGDVSWDGYNNNGLDFLAMPFSDHETDVAGYTTSDIYMYFAYTPVDGVLTRDESLTALYGAKYEFEPQNLQSMYDDIKSKLTSLYGDPADVTADKNWTGAKNTYTWWYGANDSVVVLGKSDFSEVDSDFYKDELWISYAWQKGDELLKAADDAISQSNSDTEASVYGNGSTNGL